MEIKNTALMPGVSLGTRDRDTGRMVWTSGGPSGASGTSGASSLTPARMPNPIPPNNGKYPVSHIETFLNRYTSLASVYRDYDEAILDNRENARFMRNDIGIRECLDSRQRSVAMLNWHIEPEDERSADQREFCGLLEDICKRIRWFTEYRRCCQHAIWYGKYGIRHRWGAQIIRNRSIYMPAPLHQDDWGWQPLNGDKIVFRQQRPGHAQMPQGAYEGQLGIRVGSTFKAGDMVNGRWRAEPTDYGLAYFLSPSERRLLTVHKHHIEDAAYEDGLRAGSIYGVGIRSVIYWEWVQKQETMSFLMEFLERMSGGIQIWKYPQGNSQAYDEAKAAAEAYNSGQEHILLVPVPVGDQGQYGVDVVEPGFQGIDTLHSLLTDFFGHRIKRYILGQVLSSEAESTGMGSGVAEAHLDTLGQILRSDATNLEETLTSELLESIIRINVQKGTLMEPGFRPRFVIETEEPDAARILEVWSQLIDRGLSFRKADLYELAGAAVPMPGDDVLQGGPGQGGGMPGQGGELGGQGGEPAELGGELGGEPRDQKPSKGAVAGDQFPNHKPGDARPNQPQGEPQDNSPEEVDFVHRYHRRGHGRGLTRSTLPLFTSNPQRKGNR